MSNCRICDERDDLKRMFKPGANRAEGHNLLAHTQFAELAWELGLYREDNAEEWRELKRLCAAR